MVRSLPYPTAFDIWLTSRRCAGAPFGLGRHIEAVSEEDFQTFMKVGKYCPRHPLLVC